MAFVFCPQNDTRESRHPKSLQISFLIASYAKITTYLSQISEQNGHINHILFHQSGAHLVYENETVLNNI